jgi:hypothetical protein
MPADTKAPRTRERLVKSVIIGVVQVHRQIDGSTFEVEKPVYRGQSVRLTPAQELRYDTDLAPIGATPESMMAELEMVRESYFAARRSVAPDYETV